MRAARRSSGGQQHGARAAAAHKRSSNSTSTRSASSSAQPAASAAAHRPRPRKNAAAAVFTGGVPMAEAQQTLSNWPGWSIKKPGDQDRGHTFDQRVERIGMQLGASWALRDQRAAAPGSSDGAASPDRDAVETALKQFQGHAGKALRSLLPPNSRPSGVTTEADDIQLVLPEFFVQRIQDLAHADEIDRNERDEIDRMFRMIQKSEDDINVAEFVSFLSQLKPEMSADEAAAAFKQIDRNGDGHIDVKEFEHWLKLRVRRDASFAAALSNVGHRRAWARIKIPSVKSKDLARSQSTRTQKFLLNRAIKPRMKYWVEVVGSRLSVYDTEDRVVEFGRLQLSDPEVERCARPLERAFAAGLR